jgi:hypothetical protein
MKDQKGNVRQQVLMDLVGVVVDGVAYPDVTGKNPLPHPSTDEFKAMMAKGTGLFVETIYEGGENALRKMVADGDLPAVNSAELETAIQAGNVASLINAQTLRDWGIIERKEFTLGDILFGSKTIQVNLLSDNLGDAYAASFLRLRGVLNFANVAFKAQVSPTITVAKLSPNGKEQPTYTVEAYFPWKDGELNEEYSLNGKLFTAGIAGAKDTATLARKSAAAYIEGNAAAVDARSRLKELQLQRATQAGQEMSPVPTSGRRQL